MVPNEQCLHTREPLQRQILQPRPTPGGPAICFMRSPWGAAVSDSAPLLPQREDMVIYAPQRARQVATGL